MTLGELRTIFRETLDRDDCDDATADQLLVLGLGRIQRELRAPPLERVYFVDAGSASMSSVPLPADYIESIDVLVDGLPLDKQPYRMFARLPSVDGATPWVWSRFRSTLYVKHPVRAGSRLEVLYYGEATPLADDAAANEITTSCPDLWVYAALTYGADRFILDNKGDLEARYQMILAQLNDQAARDEFVGGSMAQAPIAYDPGT